MSTTLKDNMWKTYLGISYNNILGFIWFQLNYLLEEPGKYGLQHIDSTTIRNEQHFYKTLDLATDEDATTIIESIKKDKNATLD